MNTFLLGLFTWVALSSCHNSGISREVEATAGVLEAVGDTVSALGNNIMTVYQDKKNVYWFASWEDGLYRYNGHTLLHYTTAHGLPHNRVEDLQEDGQGNLLFNTPAGVCRFDGKTFTLLPVAESEHWILQPGDLWFKSALFEGGILRYDGQVLHKLEVPECELGREWMASNPSHLSPYAVYTIYTDSKGNVWFGTAALGACRYNGVSFDWISEEDVTELHNGPSNGVRSIVEDKEGYFWFNSAYRYDVYGSSAKENGFYTRHTSIGNLDGSPDSDFWEYLSIAKDRNDQLWIATYGNGVWRYDGTRTTHYPVQVNGEDITLFSVYCDRQGDLWLGTHANGAFKLVGSSFQKFVPQ